MVKQDDLAVSISKGLTTHLIGQRVLYFPSLSSTMEVARREAQQGAAEGTVIIAGEQTSGVGRMERTWVTPPGNVALSIVLRPGLSSLPYLVMIAALTVVHTIRAVTGLEPQIKWPNDVLINGKKVSGILIENEVRGDRAAYSIVGIGINVNLELSRFPEIQAFATSLSHELGHDLPLPPVIRQLLIEMERLYLALPEAEAIYREWRDNLVTLGQKVRVRWRESVYEGVAETVDKDGSLRLRQSDGSLVKVTAGDVTLKA